MKYEHLSEEERITIAVLRESGHSIRYIADKLKRHPCTIRKEIARNSTARGYNAQAAQGKSERRRSEANAVPYKLVPETWSDVCVHLEKGWMPDVIAKRGVDKHGRPLNISGQAIYDRLHKDQRAPSHHSPKQVCRRLDGQAPYKHLRRGLATYKPRGGRVWTSHLQGAACITTRPPVVNERRRFGDYETDTMALRDCHLLVTQERKSYFVRARRLSAHDARSVMKTQCAMLKDLEVKTITSDRGSVFALHNETSDALGGAKWYAAQAGCPHQRGGVEKVIGQLRHALPRNMTRAEATPAYIRSAVNRLNNTPRKSLGYKTPAEVMPRV